jgi:hypothetical protein
LALLARLASFGGRSSPEDFPLLLVMMSVFLPRCRPAQVHVLIGLTPQWPPHRFPCLARFWSFSRASQYNGGVAQLGERVNGIHEVRGSIPLASTR